MGSIWDGLINYYDSAEGICPVAHTYITPYIGILTDKEGNFLCAMDVRGLHELAAVPCTVQSESRTSNIAPHVISDNLGYVAVLPGFEKKHGAYMEQLENYVNACPEDAYAVAVHAYVSKETVTDDIRALLQEMKNCHRDMINILFCVYGLPNEGEDRRWTEYYPSTLPENGRCAITGRKDYIPEAYPACILSPNSKSRLFLSGCGAGYRATQKIIHALQHLIYAKYTQKKNKHTDKPAKA